MVKHSVQSHENYTVGPYRTTCTLGRCLCEVVDQLTVSVSSNTKNKAKVGSHPRMTLTIKTMHKYENLAMKVTTSLLSPCVAVFIDSHTSVSMATSSS